MVSASARLLPAVPGLSKVVIFAMPTYYFPSYWGYTSAPFVTTSFSNVSPVFDNGQTETIASRLPSFLLPPS